MSLCCTLYTHTFTKPHLNYVDLPYVDLSFSVIGKTLPIDHGYSSYSALTHLQPKLHDLENISIQTIPGIPNKDGCLNLNEHSRLRIRLAADQIKLVYRFAGKKLLIGNKHKIRLDIPQIYLLEPVKNLQSRIVVIRGYEEPDTFLAAAQRQLEKLGIQGIACITTNSNGEPKRKSIKVQRFTLVGFGLEVKNLSEEDSLILQIHGIGGKHKMGCGVFNPLK